MADPQLRDGLYHAFDRMRAALEAAGGIASIRGALIDDCALATRLKRQGPIFLGLTEQVRSLRPELIKRVLQRRVELRVVERQPNLPGQVGQDAVVLVSEGVAARRTFHDDEPEQLTAVTDGGDP